MYQQTNGPIEIHPDRDFWIVRFGFRNSCGREQDWYPTLRAAKSAASGEFRHYCVSRGVEAPNRVTWKDVPE